MTRLLSRQLCQWASVFYAKFLVSTVTGYHRPLLLSLLFGSTNPFTLQPHQRVFFLLEPYQTWSAPSLTHFFPFPTHPDPQWSGSQCSFHQCVKFQWFPTLLFTSHKNLVSHFHFLSTTHSTCLSRVFHFLAHLVCHDRMTKGIEPWRNTFPFHTGDLCQPLLLLPAFRHAQQPDTHQPTQWGGL